MLGCLGCAKSDRKSEGKDSDDDPCLMDHHAREHYVNCCEKKDNKSSARRRTCDRVKLAVEETRRAAEAQLKDLEPELDRLEGAAKEAKAERKAGNPAAARTAELVTQGLRNPRPSAARKAARRSVSGSYKGGGAPSAAQRKSSKRRRRRRTKQGYTKLQDPKKQKRTSRLRTRKRTKRSKSKSQKK